MAYSTDVGAKLSISSDGENWQAIGASMGELIETAEPMDAIYVEIQGYPAKIEVECEIIRGERPDTLDHLIWGPRLN